MTIGAMKFLVLSIFVCISLTSCKYFQVSESSDRRYKTTSTGWWTSQQQIRQQAVANYIQSNQSAYDLFRHTANGAAGVPYVLFKVFPEVFPDIWRQDGIDFNLPGLVANADGKRPLPDGLGWASDYKFAGSPPPYQIVNITCGTCHMGRVLGEDGSEILIPGGVNQQFGFFQYLLTLRQTASDSRFTYDNFATALRKYEQNPDFFFNSDLLGDTSQATKLRQQAILDLRYFLSGGNERIQLIREEMLARSAAISFMERAMYQPEGTSGPRPNLTNLAGSFDAYGVAHAGIAAAAMRSGVPQEAFTFQPSRTDVPSVWMQRDRPLAQWDGSIVNPMLRALAAAGASVMNPTLLDIDLASRVSQLLEDMPALPYPFAVDESRVARGRLLAQRYCESCHSPGSRVVSVAKEVGTSPNRAQIYTPNFSTTLGNILLAQCTDPILCQVAKEQGQPTVQREYDQVGYVAGPLTGIWATAPYLHNGSVPTMRHLLVPSSRPKKFYRGSLVYDQVNLGYSWDKADQNSVIYDTGLEGQSSSGHDTARFNGDVDWENSPDLLGDLLEYLKTL